MFGNDGVSAYLKLMEAQDKAMRKLSMFETPAMLAMKNSARGQYEKLSAVQSLVKASMPLGVNDVMTELKAKFSPLDSQVTLAIKRAQIPQLNETFTAIEAISKASRILGPSQEWQQKMSAVLSPISQQSAAFKVFHEQTTRLAQMFDPSVSAYLRKHVRTDLADAEAINPVEAIYLKSFEEFNGGVADNLSEQIAATPGLKETIRELAIEFANTYLYDTFIDKLVTVIAEKLGLRKSDVVIASGLITFYLFILKPQIDSYIQSRTDEDQNAKIAWNTSRNIKQGSNIKTLKSESQYRSAIIANKENLHNILNQAIQDYEAKLSLEFRKQTVGKYTLVASTFIDYLDNHTEHTDIKQVTKSDIENFIADVQFDDLRTFKGVEIRYKLSRFLTFMKSKR